MYYASLDLTTLHNSTGDTKAIRNIVTSNAFKVYLLRFRKAYGLSPFGLKTNKSILIYETHFVSFNIQIWRNDGKGKKEGQNVHNDKSISKIFGYQSLTIGVIQLVLRFYYRLHIKYV